MGKYSPYFIKECFFFSPSLFLELLLEHCIWEHAFMPCELYLEDIQSCVEDWLMFFECLP